MANTVITQEAYLPLNLKVTFIATFDGSNVTYVGVEWSPNEPSPQQIKKIIKKYRAARATFHQNLADITNSRVACFDVASEQVEEFNPTVRN